MGLRNYKKKRYGQTDYASGRAPATASAEPMTYPAPVMSESYGAPSRQMGSLSERGFSQAPETEHIAATESGAEMTPTPSAQGGDAAMSAAGSSALIGAGGAVIEGVQKAEAARRAAVIDDAIRMRRQSVEALKDSADRNDRALAAIDRVYERYTS